MQRNSMDQPDCTRQRFKILLITLIMVGQDFCHQPSIIQQQWAGQPARLGHGVGADRKNLAVL